MRFKIKLAIGFLLTLSIFFALSVYSYLTRTQQVESSRWVTHTNEVLYSSQRLLTGVLDAETGYRGYILTGNARFLEPYTNATDSIKSRLAELQRLSADNTAQQAKIKRLATVIHEKIKWGEQVIAAHEAGFEDARRLVTSQRGKNLMGEIRGIVNDFQVVEKRLLTGRAAENEMQIQDFNDLSLATLILIIIILLTMFRMIFVNLRARQRADAALQKAADEIRDLYNNAPCGYHSVNAHGLIVEMNETELHWLGYSRQEVVRKLMLNELISEGAHQVFEDNFHLFKQLGYLHNLELELKRKDGSTFPVVVSSTAIADANGNFAKSRTTVFDNTEQKQYELSLRKAADEIQDLYDNAPCGYLSVDSSILLSNINQTLLHWLGYTSGEVIGKMKYEDLLSGESKAAFLSTFEKDFESYKENGSVHDLEFEFQRKDGTTFPVLVSSTAILTEKGEFIKSRSTVADNTERKKGENKIKLLNQELEAFTYSVSHDLRAPLRAVVGYAQMLKEDYGSKLDKEGQRITEVIITSANRMGQLIDDLLDFSRLGRKELTKSNLNMDEIVQSILRELIPPENGRKIDVKINPLRTSPADVSMLRQVWINLISNALKYSQKKEITKIEIGSFDENGHTGYYISDNGAGFDMRYVDKLFGVFQRLHKISEFEGTGVGLALVKRIVQRHGGVVGAEGKINEGARFYFTLPKN